MCKVVESRGKSQKVVQSRGKSQRQRDDNKNKIFASEGGGGALGAERKGNRPKTHFFFRGKRHDNEILNLHILSSRNFVVIAQAPKVVQSRANLLKSGTFPRHRTRQIIS